MKLDGVVRQASQDYRLPAVPVLSAFSESREEDFLARPQGQRAVAGRPKRGFDRADRVGTLDPKCGDRPPGGRGRLDDPSG